MDRFLHFVVAAAPEAVGRRGGPRRGVLTPRRGGSGDRLGIGGVHTLLEQTRVMASALVGAA